MNPVVGYRTWRVIGNTLHGVMSAGPANREWPLDGGPAICPRNNGAPCSRGCECGWYAHEAPNPPCAFWNSAIGTETHHKGGGLVVGACVAWGRVALYERGFRAEYARPVVLVRNGYSAAVALRYRTALVDSVEQLAAVAVEHGDPWTPDAVTA